MPKTISFIKMVGAGNDFIVIRAQKNINYRLLAKRACDRTNGIGADGILVIDKSCKADVRMRIFNADGSEAEMCGNGARCFAAVVFDKEAQGKNTLNIETLAGIIVAKKVRNDFKIRLSPPSGYKTNIPIKILGQKIHVQFIDTGVPHTIIFVDHLQKINIPLIGRAIRFHKKFQPRGTNVNFIEQIKKNLIAVRTYERGVEDETKACGTGSVAAAIVAFLQSRPLLKTDHAVINVKTASSEILQISFDVREGTVSNVWLKGSAKQIALGEYFLHS